LQSRCAQVAHAPADPDHEVFVSAVSTWEIAIKRELGKLRAPSNLSGVIAEEGFIELPTRSTISLNDVEQLLFSGIIRMHTHASGDRPCQP
jgi:PIN domain nuclease of toxin-antitoxin system